jgi:hypothetical protein
MILHKIFNIFPQFLSLFAVVVEEESEARLVLIWIVSLSFGNKNNLLSMNYAENVDKKT